MYPIHLVLVLSGRFTWPFHFPAALAPLSLYEYSCIYRCRLSVCPSVYRGCLPLFLLAFVFYCLLFEGTTTRAFEVVLPDSPPSPLLSTPLRTLPRIYLNISDRLICLPNIVRFLTSKIRSLSHHLFCQLLHQT